MTDIFDLSGMPDTQIRLTEEPPVVAQFQHGVSLIVVLDEAGLPFLRALPTLVPQKFLREIIIVDRGAPDELMTCLHKIEKDLPLIRVISNKGKLSQAQCMNLAARRAFGKYIMFVSQHALLPKDATMRLLLSFSGKPDDKPVMVSAQIHALQGEKGDKLFDPKQATLALLGKDKTLNQIPTGRRDYHVSAVPFGCFMVERSQFWLSDGFDATLSDAMQADLCLKMHLQGGGVYQVSDLSVRVYPDSRGVRPSYMKQKLGWIKYYLKHYKKAPTRRWLVPLAVLLFAKGLVQTMKSFFKRKDKSNIHAEPSISELLGRKDLV